MWLNPQETADLVTFTEEILSGKYHFLCSEEKAQLIRKANIFSVTQPKQIFTLDPKKKSWWF